MIRFTTVAAMVALSPFKGGDSLSDVRELERVQWVMKGGAMIVRR